MTLKHYAGISLIVIAALIVGALIWQFSKELIYVAIFLAIVAVIAIGLYLYRLWDDVRTRQITRYHLKAGQEHERWLQTQQIEHQREMERERLRLEGERITLERERLHITSQLDFRRVIVPGGHTVVFADEEQGYIPIAAAHMPQIARTGQNEDTPSLAPAIEAIPAVVRYDDIRQQVPEGLSLLGIHPSNGDLELIEPRLYKIVWFVGGSDTGKTNTVYGLTSDMVERFVARLLVADPHAQKKDSLTRKLAPLYYALYRGRDGKAIPPAVNTKQIKGVLQTFMDEFCKRLEGTDCSVPVLLVADEIGNMLRNEELAPMVRKLVQTCGDEIRGFNMFFFGISQRAAYLKFLRDAAQTIIVHGLLQESEAMLAVNNDKALARKVQEFARHKGRTVVYGYEFDSMILQQPLHTIPQNEQATRVVESWLAGNPPAMDDLPEKDTDEVEALNEADFSRDVRDVRPDGKRLYVVGGARMEEDFSMPPQRGEKSFNLTQSDTLNVPVETAHAAQDARIDYPRLDEIQEAIFATAYELTGNKDESLRRAGANTRYRQHATEIIEHRGLKKREAR